MVGVQQTKRGRSLGKWEDNFFGHPTLPENAFKGQSRWSKQIANGASSCTAKVMGLISPSGLPTFPDGNETGQGTVAAHGARERLEPAVLQTLGNRFLKHDVPAHFDSAIQVIKIC